MLGEADPAIEPRRENSKHRNPSMSRGVIPAPSTSAFQRTADPPLRALDRR